MPLMGVTVTEQRLAFVLRAPAEGANIRARCREFGISPDTAYRLRDAYRAEGSAGLRDRSRRPATSPAQTPPESEAHVLAVRAVHPTWGGRKIHAWVRDQAGSRTPQPPVPSPASSVDTTSCVVPERVCPVPFSVLNGRRRTSCGRWISSATRRSRRAAVFIP